MFNKIIVGILMFLCAGTSYAQPVKLTIVVPYPTGTVADNLARTLSNIITEQTGISTLVINKAGAAGTIGAKMVAESKSESTVLFTDQATVYTNRLLKLPNSIDIDQLKIVTAVSNGYTVLTVPYDSPFNTIQELMYFIRRNPEKSIYGAAGIIQIIQSKNLLHRADITDGVESILMRSQPELQSSIIRGDITFAFLSQVNAISLSNANKLKILAIDFDTRSRLLPSTPTTSEIYGPAPFTSWHGIFVSSNVQESTRQELNTIWMNAIDSPKFIKILHEQDRVKLGYTIADSEKFFNEQLNYTIKMIDNNKDLINQ
jgi:tripartite-type tricarboxylate transporter receptor subunit TctC